MPYIPPPSVKFWCLLCDRPYWYVPGVGTYRASSYHSRDTARRSWPKALCTDHYEIAKRGVAGYEDIEREALKLEDYYRKKFGGTWRRGRD